MAFYNPDSNQHSDGRDSSALEVSYQAQNRKSKLRISKGIKLAFFDEMLDPIPQTTEFEGYQQFNFKAGIKYNAYRKDIYESLTDEQKAKCAPIDVSGEHAVGFMVEGGKVINFGADGKLVKMFEDRFSSRHQWVDELREWIGNNYK